MTPVSLMPPVDYCPSCEGKKAESKAAQIGESRARQAELQSATDPLAAPSPGSLPPLEAGAPIAGGDEPKPVSSAVQSLLAPDLAVQASLAGSSVQASNIQVGGDGAGSSEAEALRLRAAAAYQAT